mmetsp:Transcript_3686/g.11216  ORF Transcript_3686/g.11216 Transcript_3686/m.11216 type:complete len:220 (-) Transcript_3686:344-1003(-)
MGAAVDRQVRLVGDDLGRLRRREDEFLPARLRFGPLRHGASQRELALDRRRRVLRVQRQHVPQLAAQTHAVLKLPKDVVEPFALGAAQVRFDRRRVLESGRRAVARGGALVEAGELVQLVNVGDDDPIVVAQRLCDEFVAVPGLGVRRERPDPDVVVHAGRVEDGDHALRVLVVFLGLVQRDGDVARRDASLCQVEVEEVGQHGLRLGRRGDDGVEVDV